MSPSRPAYSGSSLTQSSQGPSAPLYASAQHAPGTDYGGHPHMSPQYPSTSLEHPKSTHPGYPEPDFSNPFPPSSSRPAAYAQHTSAPQTASSSSIPPGMYARNTHPGDLPLQPVTSNYQGRPISGQRDSEGGTWWYVPPPPRSQHDAPGPSASPAHPQTLQARAHDESPAQMQHSTHVSLSTPLSSSSQIPAPGRERPVGRRAYHPDPPARRSEWVMWAGNVPNDAQHDELWDFFTHPPDVGASSSTGDARDSGGGGSAVRNGVLSIFPITRSKCAFVNYETEAELQAAVARFDGVSMRAADPHCALLTCRVRGKQQDLRAGVGGQRGTGMHKRWVDAQAEAQGRNDRATTEQSGPESSNSTNLRSNSSNSSGSHASTNSSLLARYFPQRFFVLKSLTEDDLDASVRSGVWATQRHNEGILDRAFRNAVDVFLFLSANKSREFYGYARMAGPLTRTAPSAALLFSSGHIVDASPRPLPFPTPLSTPLRPRDLYSAPALLGATPRALSGVPPAAKHGLDRRLMRPIELDAGAPLRGMRGGEGNADAPRDGGAPRDFKLQWLCTQHLPFQRTRHIRNPWNHDLEVKVSRDGTELEPAVGHALLQEWRRFLGAQGT
ncbi:YT521-B-like domain-containing protein [Mycena maculata]|uniref:YT521-B-like domain-containing protein n=1 Tax=Mycena maculata TaxID=230809 RepID=A0AAD7JZZ4_9AGAR|nr:YT521-B-like domain-containing protein [Mycena maculata]